MVMLVIKLGLIFFVWEGWGEIKKASFERRLLVTPEGLEPSTH